MTNRPIDHPALQHFVLMTNEAADIFRYDPSTIRELCRSGLLRGFRYGKRGEWRIYRDSVLFRLAHGFEATEPLPAPEAVDTATAGT